MFFLLLGLAHGIVFVVNVTSGLVPGVLLWSDATIFGGSVPVAGDSLVVDLTGPFCDFRSSLHLLIDESTPLLASVSVISSRDRCLDYCCRRW
jgi:hypothetical protein